MKSSLALALVLLLPLVSGAAQTHTPSSGAAGEYAKHFDALAQLSVAVAEAMPREKYSFKPHPESMDFGQLMAHIATTNYQFCAGLRNTSPPAMPNPTDKAETVRFLGNSFSYCSTIIAGLTQAQLARAHDSPDGHLPGRDVLLVMYIHVAHHRGQAEIYLRDNGIRPPGYRI